MHKNVYGSVRLVASVQRDDPETLQKLLEEREDYGPDDLAKALHIAADKGNEECCQLLLAHNALPNIHDASGFTPVVIAARRGHANIVKMLIDAGSNVKKPTFRIRATALHWAATNGHYGCVCLLLKAGANPEAQTVHRRTPLMLASRSDNPDIVEELLAAGANVNKGDTAGATALHLAAEEGSVECVELLLKAGAKVNSQLKCGDTPLMQAAKRGQYNELS